jgi:PAS domain S-box-containing protein
MPDGMTIAAGPPDFPIIANSRSTLELLGQPEASVIGLPAGDHSIAYGLLRAAGVSLPTREQMPLYRASHLGETVTNEEWVIQRADGENITVLVNVVPIRDRQGCVLGAISCWRDITARKQSETAQRCLTEVSTLLATAHDLSSQLEQLAGLLVPTLADWCSIDLLHDDGQMHRHAVVHADPTKAALAKQLHQQSPVLAADAEHPLARVLRTGQSWFDPVVSKARRQAETRDAGHWDLLQALGFQAEMVVPLLARGRVLGTITCVLGAGARRYSAADLALAEELARRAAVAIENTRLYQAAQTAQAALQQANAVLERRVEERTALLQLLYDLTATANVAPSLEEALQQALDRIRAFTGWPVGHVYLSDPDGSGTWTSTSIWHLDDPGRFAAFQQVTQTTQFAPGEGLIGRVGMSGHPEWSADVTTAPTFLRRQAAEEVRLTAGCAVPLFVQQEVVGVLEFYTDKMGAPDTTWLDALGQIGTQLGRMIERQRATEQAQRQQDALLQREKLATMSMLLANVAHELNNPLAIIVMQADLLQEDLRGGPLTEPVADIAQAAERCERLVRQFLTMARQQPPERAAVALNMLVAETVELLTYPFQVDNVVVHLHLDDQAPPLWGDPHQLQQVVVNLLTNAQQALRAVPGRRKITLTTQYDPTQHQITLAVTDTGPGIPPALQGRIFEPFYTSKPPGVGTGLGLPLCRGIVETHGGTLDVTSTLGQGATFRVTLPVETAPASPPALPSVAEGHAGRGLTILLVDDELSLARGLARLLRRDGHTVDTVAHGRLALAKVDEHAYDLILSDIRMPELDGPSLYRLLERQHPHLCQRLIFLTGDTLEPTTWAFLEENGMPCLTKPFTLAEVRRAIQRAAGGDTATIDDCGGCSR